MNNLKKSLGILLFPIIAYANTTETLETIEVEVEGFKESERALLKNSASTTKDNVSESTQTLDTILRSVPGAFTQIDKSSGTVSVNIRGGTGFGRVNSMIDGVTQTFYASSADGSSRNSSTSQFGNLVDPGFLNYVEIDRGSFGGSAGANSLLGSANFKTFGVQDIVAKGNNIGFMGKYLWGSNATPPQILGIVGLKKDFTDDRWLGMMVGYSERNLSQNYRIGGGRNVTESSIDLTGLDEYDIEQTDTSPFSAEHVKQKPVSHIAKLEYGDKYQQGSLSYRDYKSKVGGRSIINRNHQLNYNFKLPEHSWLDLNLLFARNQTVQKYDTGARIVGKPLVSPLEAKNKSDTFDLSNTFTFNIGDASLQTRIGINHLKTKYDKNRDPAEELNINLEEGNTFETEDCFGLDCYRKSFSKSTFQPDGKAKYSTVYVDNSLTYKLFTLDYNFNIGRYKLTGNRSKYFADYIDELEKARAKAFRNRDSEEIQRLSQRIEALKNDVCTVDEDDEEECPDFNFIVQDQTSGKFYNYSTALSAYLHDLFTPFIGYSKSHRAPNIKEVFFSSVSDLGVNTQLKPEEAKTLQFGLNGFKTGVLTENDKLGYKISAYHTRIKNYIHNVDDRDILFKHKKPFNDTVIVHRNLDRLVKIKGVELEFNYDLGNFYINLAYARQKNNQPVSFTDGSSRAAGASDNERLLQGFGASKISMLPRDYGSLEIGSRWFDRKFILGGIAKYYGKSKRVLSTPEESKVYISSSKVKYVLERTRKTEEIGKQPIIFDLYMSYEPIKNLVLKAEVQNIFDKKYTNPLDANNDSASQAVFNLDLSDKTINVLNNFARGRTYIFTLSYKY
ncbi:TonB-dependent receptor domain-containing protein [Ursidibacter arcticus]